MHRQPNGVLSLVGPGHTVAHAGRDQQMVAGFELDNGRFILKLQTGLAFYQQDPFVPLLVIPELFRGAVTSADDAFDFDVIARSDHLVKFFGQMVGDVCR